MRSFIKTHRRASSLDNSPNKSLQESPDSRRNSQGSFGTDVSHNSAYPAGYGLKQSSSFEPLHKITSNKIFSSKLFRKSSSRNTSSNTSPLLNRSDNEVYFRPVSEEDDVPAIKGTRRHAWGDNGDKSDSVILLNRTSLSSTSDTNQEGLDYELIRHHGTKQNGRKSSQTTEDDSFHKSIAFSKSASVTGTESLKKKRNRLARIHSHDDIMNFQSGSSFTQNLLNSSFSPIAEASQPTSPLPSFEKSPKNDRIGLQHAQPDEFKDFLDTAFSLREDNALKSHADGSSQLPRGGEITTDSKWDFTQHTVQLPRGNQQDATRQKVPIISVSSSSGSSEEYDDDSDSSSKFSFQNSTGIIGRTASLKYYSTEDPAPKLYLNDLYEHDNFDDDMNYFDSNEEDYEDTDHLFGGESSATSGFAGMCNISDDEIVANCSPRGIDNPAIVKPVDRAAKVPETFQDSSLLEVNEENNQTNNIESYADIYDISDEELEDNFNEGDRDTQTGQDFGSSNGRSYGNPTSDTSNGVSKYADIFKLSDEELDSTISQRSTEKEPNRFPALNQSLQVPSNEREQIPVVQSQLRSPVRYLDRYDSQNHHSLDSYKTPERNIVVSPPRLPMKFHSISSSLDHDITGSMSKLYFIEETGEEDSFDTSAELEEYCLDEINEIPEDFGFVEEDTNIAQETSPTDRMKRNNLSAFRRTHSYSDKPLGVLKEKTPVKYKLEIKNKTVTFFDNTSVHRSYSEPFSSSMSQSKDVHSHLSENQVLDNTGLTTPVTPNNSFSKPSPSFTQNSSLSPIQESTVSSDTSPKLL